MYYWCTHVINIHTFIPCYVFKQYSAAPVWPGIPETAYNFHSTTRLYAIPPNKPRIHPSLSFSHTTNCTLICFDIHVDIASSSFAKLIARPDNKHRSSGEHLSTTTVCLGSINQSNQERFPYGDISEYDMSIWAVVAVSHVEESTEAWSIWDHRRKRHANPNLDMTNYTGTRQDVVIRLTLRSIPRNTLIVNRDVRTLRYRVWVKSLSQPDLPSTSMTLKPYSYIFVKC